MLFERTVLHKQMERGRKIHVTLAFCSLDKGCAVRYKNFYEAERIHKYTHIKFSAAPGRYAFSESIDACNGRGHRRVQ